ncbi:alpha/beta fold hydrolase [Brevundimonas sp.]|uniref:alpha/beta fold hydrolase n=1 Tax=Brevundimonas sp. TaxID=1871086 RepID=UPI002731C3E9|nr:alpha/beta hydrolase [Brevundimonas sp.]MDP1913143.1 alpha/beta hydrolase [Brevundimonas sp.]
MSQTFAERRWTSSDGLCLYARDYAAASGTAKLPVIAIHGLTRNSADFDAIAPLIAQSGRRVLAVDIRGRGQSDRAPDPVTYQPATYAQDVLALLNQSGIERAVFLGTSMGGLITLAASGLRPKAVAAAILNDIGPDVVSETLTAIADYICAPPVEIATWDEAAAYIRSFQSANFPRYTDADWDSFARRTFRVGTDGSLVLDYDPDIAVPVHADGPKVMVPPLWPQFRRLAKQRPVLLVRGELSKLLGPTQVAKMRKRAPKMDFVEVPGVGHAPMLDEPEAKAAIFPFLSELP